MEFRYQKRYFIRALDRLARILQVWHDRLKNEESFADCIPAVLDIQYRLQHLSHHVLAECAAKRKERRCAK